jgi:Aromatic-ring-opening dioxygenase LigAB, LigA subunit
MSDALLYPRPAIRDLELHTVLHDLQENPELFRAFLDDPDAALKRLPLDDDARKLLGTRDYQGMVARGIHPILVISLQRQIEWGMTMRADDSGGDPKQ